MNLMSAFGERTIFMSQPTCVPLFVVTIPEGNVSPESVRHSLTDYSEHPVYCMWGKFEGYSGNAMRILVYPKDVF